MTTMIVFPEPLEGVNTHFMCGPEHIFLRSDPSGLKSLPVDTLVLLPGCNEEQKKLALECTRTIRFPMILGV